MPRKKSNAKVDEAALKQDIRGYPGGMPVDLDRKMATGRTLREDLSNLIADVLEQEIGNQAELLDKLPQWQRQYKGRRKKKSDPWPSCANVATPITRSNIDTVFVRVFDSLLAANKLILCKPVDADFVDIAPKIEEGINHWLRNTVKAEEKLFDPMLQGFKAGTGILMIDHVSQKRAIYRYANDLEEDDPDIEKFKLKGTDRKAVKEIVTVYEGPDWFPIPREDWIMSSDADCPEDAFLCGFKKEYRPADMMLKVRQGLWDKEEIDKCVEDSLPDEVKTERKLDKNKEITQVLPVTMKKNFWELYVRYDVDEDGEEDDILVTFNLESKTIPKAIYNPNFFGFRPFELYTPLPSEYSADGDSACELLASIQDEIDTIHNQRLDRMSSINAFLTLIREGSGLEKLEYMKPGEVHVVPDELESSIKIVQWPDTYHSTEREEDRLIEYANRALGITPGVQGMPTADRPVARVEFAHIQEANRRFKRIIEHSRDFLARCTMKSIEMMAQYQPEYTYTVADGQKVESKTLSFPIEYIRDGLKVETYASSEVLNQELRRVGDDRVPTFKGLLHRVGTDDTDDFRPDDSGAVQTVPDSGYGCGVEGYGADSNGLRRKGRRGYFDKACRVAGGHRVYDGYPTTGTAANDATAGSRDGGTCGWKANAMNHNRDPFKVLASQETVETAEYWKAFLDAVDELVKFAVTHCCEEEGDTRFYQGRFAALKDVKRLPARIREIYLKEREKAGRKSR